VYPGIDVEYHANGRRLEYDFVVQPGSNPDKIRIGFSGTRGTFVNSSGDLVLKTDSGDLVQKKPLVYQEIDGDRRVVDATYVVGRGHVGFQVAGYDRTRPLVIDPELILSTYFGGTGTEQASGVAVDSQNAIYVTGTTTSTDFPIQSAAQPAYKGGST